MQKQTGESRAVVTRPEDILSDLDDHTQAGGLTVRKGTIAAFLQNAIQWSDEGTDENSREALAREMAGAMPALEALGVFKVFEVRDGSLRALLLEL